MLPSALPRTRSPEPHVPVLAREVRELLAVRPGETVVDCTFGAGGHARAAGRGLGGEGALVAIDRDPSARRTSRRSADALPGMSSSAALRGNFAPCLRNLAATGVRADAILHGPRRLLDAARPARARLLLRHDAPLDMRMDPADAAPPPTLVNELRRAASSRAIFRRYGEERYARQIARAIVRAPRERAVRRRTGELVETIKRAIPTPARFGRGHPAKRVFQALRIAVNDELGRSPRPRPRARLLRPGGRIAVIAFHSLEDRMVKHFLARPRRRLHLPARPARLRLRARAADARAHAARRPARRRRGRGEPARRVRAPARGRAHGEPAPVSSRAATAEHAARRGRSRPEPEAARKPQRTAASGRFASLPNGLVVIAVGALLCGIVALQVAALRANMASGDMRREVRAVETQSANLRAAIERKRADGRVEAAALRLGMVRPPIDAVRTVRLPRTPTP